MFKNYSSNSNINLLNVICIIVIFYLLYKDLTRKEGFGQTEDINAAISTRYGADVEAIRNLSELATKLTTGGLTVPGNVTINGQLNTEGDLVLDGSNKWVIHTPNDGRKTMYIAPYGATAWDWGKQITITNEGDFSVNGNLYIGSVISCSNIKISNPIIGAYMINAGIGNTHGKQYGISYSIDYRDYGVYDNRTLAMDNADDYYIVLPNYKLIVYEYLYSGNSSIMDNTTGTTPKGFECNIFNVYNGTNQGSSCKLFYKDQELIYPFSPRSLSITEQELAASNVRVAADLVQAVKG